MPLSLLLLTLLSRLPAPNSRASDAANDEQGESELFVTPNLLLLVLVEVVVVVVVLVVALVVVLMLPAVAVRKPPKWPSLGLEVGVRAGEEFTRTDFRSEDENELFLEGVADDDDDGCNGGGGGDADGEGEDDKTTITPDSDADRLLLLLLPCPLLSPVCSPLALDFAKSTSLT